MARASLEVAEAALPRQSRPSPRRQLLGRLWKLRLGLIGLLMVLVVIVAALFSKQVAPHDPFEQDITARFEPPYWMPGGSLKHLLGTDRVGRDVLSRIIYGSQVSLTVGALAMIIATGIGVTLGLLAGFYGRWVDSLISALVNLLLAFPFILLAVATVAVVGPSFRNMIVVLGLTAWPIFTRLVRAEALRIRHQDFVLAGRAIGASDPRLLTSYLLPNMLHAVIVLSSLEVARLIILESFLSFLGLGVPPPTPSWGSMLSEGRTQIFDRWWLVTFPGLAIFMTTLGINLLGDAIRDLFDPRLNQA